MVAFVLVRSLICVILNLKSSSADIRDLLQSSNASRGDAAVQAGSFFDSEQSMYKYTVATHVRPATEKKQG